MSDGPLRVLVIVATDGFTHALPQTGAGVRALELNRHLAKGGHRVEVEMLLYDLNPDSTPTTSWPFPVHYLTHDDYYCPDGLRLAERARCLRPDVMVVSDSALLVRCGRTLADAVGTSLVYEMHAVERVPALAMGSTAAGVHDGVVQREAIRLADAVVTFTDRDARHAIDAGASQVSIVPAGASPVSAAMGPVPGGPVVMAADFTRESNAQALATVNSRLPKTVQAKIYGRYPATLPPLLPRLTLHGPVPHLHAVLANASAGIASHSEASGMRAQLLAYMATGLPVIATPQALVGYPNPTSFALISERPDMADLPDLLERLRDDPLLARALGSAGRKLVEGKLSWAHIALQAASAYKATRPTRASTKPRSEPRMLTQHPPRWLSAQQRTLRPPPPGRGSTVPCSSMPDPGALGPEHGSRPSSPTR